MTIWWKPGKMDWQPIPGKKKNGKADIVDISKSIAMKKVVVEIHQDRPQQILSNLNWKNLRNSQMLIRIIRWRLFYKCLSLDLIVGNYYHLLSVGSYKS